MKIPFPNNTDHSSAAVLQHHSVSCGYISKEKNEKKKEEFFFLAFTVRAIYATGLHTHMNELKQVNSTPFDTRPADDEIPKDLRGEEEREQYI